MRRFIIFLLAMTLHLAVHAADVFVSSGADESQNINAVLYYADDPTENLSISDITQKHDDFFQALTKPNYGFGFKGVRWVRFKIDLTKDTGDYWFLQQNYMHVQNWTIYYQDEGQFKSVNLSEDFNVQSKFYTIPHLLVKLPRPKKGPAVYYARYEPRGHALNIDLVKMSERSMVENLHADTLTTGLFFGSLLVLILYNVFLCVMLRSAVYAYYVYYLTSFALAFIYLTGYAPMLVQQMSVRWEQIFAAFSFAAIHGMTLSGRSILNLNAALPKTHKVLLFCELCLFSGIIGSFFMPIGIHYRILNPLILLATVILLFASIRRSIQGYQPAQIYAVGWISFILLMMCYALTFIGFLPLNWFTTNSVKVAAVLEATLFSIALALRFKLGAEMAAKAKNAFLGMVSHELKTPLQTIISCLDIISNDGGIIRNELTLKRLASAAKQLEVQVSDLTDFAHLESGHLKLRYADFKPSELIKEIVAQYKKSAQDKQLSISMEILDDDFCVHADALRTKQIVSNLIENSIKYTKHGHIIIRLANCCDEDQRFFVIEVEDTGIGIAEEHIKSIYQPFVQVDQSLQRKYRGIGMGLTIVKNLISLMNGQIEVESTLNKGTIFTVTIPYASVQGGLDQEIANNAPCQDQKRILLVDDEPETLALLGEILKSMNCRAVCCSSGRSALIHARVNQYDAILLDVNMPDVDGISVAKKIRQFKNYAHTPIIWISATKPENGSDVDLSVFTRFMEKPIRSEVLAQFLKDI